MTTEEFVIPDDQINHYAKLSEWMNVSRDIWHAVDIADLTSMQYGDQPESVAYFEELREMAIRIDEKIKHFFGLSDDEFYAKKY